MLLILTLLAMGGILLFTGVVGNILGRDRFAAKAAASADVLLQAKLSLLGYAASVTTGASGYRLGNLLTPDIQNASATAIV